MTDFTYDRTDLEQCADAIRKEKTECETAFTGITETVTAESSALGSDEAGQAFAAIYDDAAQQALSAVKNAAGGLEHLIDRLEQTMQAYDHTEQHNTDAGRGIYT